ncbi:hypothetical protein BKA82DRAFT_618147 [Pisolithus tinctorius]|uniref:Uncharacterized protein n=1 Tax=Pisolithus tinctorius Marx 270 TaxID=870435 RepID=A0A0C3P710_PISTI|nr:hypothetical protein BKA82DRAFT_618147 [Pisolithus tinctorius]KIO03361.1 hypothetical protein M404DRAFT_618147 [Pisolithus tinctorius Marx 270]
MTCQHLVSRRGLETVWHGLFQGLNLIICRYDLTALFPHFGWSSLFSQVLLEPLRECTPLVPAQLFNFELVNP